MNKKELERLKQELIKMENKYKLAKEKLELILRHLDLEYSENLKEDNPIEHINFRVKKVSSIQKKLIDKGRQCTLENIDNYLSDIVGARIVCPFLSDVEKVVESLKKHPELQILICKDYINNPKETGYASYHMIVKVPIVINNQTNYVKAEIQIRTMAMDMWASLDHKIRYKKEIEISDRVKEIIISTAKECNELDKNLNQKYLQEKNRVKSIKDSTQEDWLNDRSYQRLMNKYEYALNQTLGKIKLLNKEYDDDEKEMKEVNPIEHIKYRMKPKERMFSKLIHQTKDLSIISLENNINDIAGIRIVCSFKSDLFKIVDTLKSNLGLPIIKEKDYVSNPKESGYAGYHLIVGVPVPQYGSYAKVEIQVRTIAMDMWASLEQKLCYRKRVDKETKNELLQLAYTREEIDEKMDAIIKETRPLVKERTKKLP